MKKTILALATSVLALSSASAAHADSFSPAGSTTVFTGSVNLSGSPIVLTCTMTMTVTANAAGTDAQVTAADLGLGLCATLPIGNLPWNIDVFAPIPPPTGLTATQLQVSGAQVGFCGPGNVIANWNTGGPSITLPAGTMLMPGSCRMQGTLTQSSGPSLTITN